jgi:glycosyltransferase involved in cell wall biosynthesis
MTRKDCYDISIVTISYNAVQTITKTIESVIDQDGLSIQYIIIDGGSTDGSVDIIKTYADRLAYWISERDAGIYDAMNKGIAQATGELVGIINSDDWYARGVLKVAYDQHLKNPNAVIHGDMMLVSENSEDLYSLTAPDRPSVQGEFQKMTVNHPATFVPRHLYERYGAFDLSYRLSADYELMIRLLSKGVPFVPLHEVTSYFRLGGQSGGIRTYKENFAIQRKYGRSLLGASGWYVKAMIKLWIGQLLPTSAWALINKLKNRNVSKAGVN